MSESANANRKDVDDRHDKHEKDQHVNQESNDNDESVLENHQNQSNFDPHAESPPRDKYKLGSGEKTLQRSPGQRKHANTRKGNRFMRNTSLAYVEGEEEVEFMRTKNGYVRTLQEITREREIHDRIGAKRKSFRLVTPINTDMVQDVCRSVNSKLSLKKITIDQLLDNNLARYLIEDNTQNQINFRLTMEAENSLVRSRARFIIGRIRIFTPTEETEIQKQIATVMKKHGDNLYTQLILNGDVKKSLMVYKEQIFKSMQYLDVDMTKSQQEYYFMRLFELSNDPNRFKLDDTCKLFDQYYVPPQP